MVKLFLNKITEFFKSISTIINQVFEHVIYVDYDEDMDYIMSNPIDKQNFNIAIQKLKDNMNILNHSDNTQTIKLTNGNTITIGLMY